jgi:transposase-like protein
MSDTPETLMDAVRYYADKQICFETMLRVKWPDGKPTCSNCGGEKVGVVASRQLLQCKAAECRKQFSVKVGTIFEDSPLGLDKWFVAVWSIANAKNGISSCELARALGVRQPTAWFMLHRIRLAMQTRAFRKLDGEVESDETHIGGKHGNMHAGRRAKAKAKSIAQALLERGGEVRAQVVAGTDDTTLLRTVRENVEPGATVYTDAHPSYRELAFTHFHKFIDHATRYVLGRIHTNGLENFFSLLKRSLKGTYTHVASFHLQAYLDEQAFRFNQRHQNDGGRFRAVLAAVVGKRITYRALTAQDDAGFMGLT